MDMHGTCYEITKETVLIKKKDEIKKKLRTTMHGVFFAPKLYTLHFAIDEATLVDETNFT